MPSPSKFLVLFRPHKASSILFRSFISAKSFLQKEPTYAFAGFCKTNCESSLASRFGFRSFCSGNEIEMKKGDWTCPECNFHNFARNIRCLKCQAEGPKRVDANKTEMKAGDWICPQCRFMNFARNMSCLRCQEQKPAGGEMRPGDWKCPACDFQNFARNTSCLKCNKERHEEAENNNSEFAGTQ